MSSESLSILFRVLAGAFLCSLLFSLYNAFREKGSKKKAIYAGYVCAALFISLVWVVFHSANLHFEGIQDGRISFKPSSDNPNPYASSTIYQDIALTIGIAVRLVLIGVITAMLIYLWNKSKTYPDLVGIYIHKALIGLGFAGVAYFSFYEARECIQSVSYREVLPFGLYALFFAGGMFWMFLCSIVAAATLPEDYDSKKKISNNTLKVEGKDLDNVPNWRN
jgi:hypothetical protein